MITGKKSVKGFALLFFALITILVLICTCISSVFWGIVGGMNTIINGWVIWSLYKYWCSE